jgi:hypothetical protein
LGSGSITSNQFCPRVPKDVIGMQWFLIRRSAFLVENQQMITLSTKK